jgi:CO/xanthine dehydrogenase FAD-binding subunit
VRIRGGRAGIGISDNRSGGCVLTCARNPYHTFRVDARYAPTETVVHAMKPAAFRYIAARSREEALALKVEHGDEARFLAGGQSLMPILNFRLAQPAILIDINPLTELAGIRRHDNRTLRVGALTRYRSLERDPLVAQHFPLVHEALPHIAHPQIRNRGTLGGNLAHADPASEMPAIVLALGGRLRAQSTVGERWIAAENFFVGALATALRADEMLVEVELPQPAAGSGSCFLELSRRRGDFALMGVAAIVTLAPDGTCIAARLTYCSAGDRPIAAVDAAGSLVGGRIGDADIRAAAALARRAIDPAGNVHASKDYQRHLAAVLTRRALLAAAARACALAGAGRE